jgi:hypothetical protein
VAPIELESPTSALRPRGADLAPEVIRGVSCRGHGGGRGGFKDKKRAPWPMLRYLTARPLVLGACGQERLPSHDDGILPCFVRTGDKAPIESGMRAAHEGGQRQLRQGQRPNCLGTERGRDTRRLRNAAAGRLLYRDRGWSKLERAAEPSLLEGIPASCSAVEAQAQRSAGAKGKNLEAWVSRLTVIGGAGRHAPPQRFWAAEACLICFSLETHRPLSHVRQRVGDREAFSAPLRTYHDDGLAAYQPLASPCRIR